MSQTRQPQAIFPDLPREAPVVDKSGNFTQIWSLAMSQLFQTLQANYKNEGILLPPLNITQINSIADVYAAFIGSPLPTNPPLADISGQTIFDSTNRVPKVFIITFDGATPPNVTAASWKTYTLT